MNTVKTTYRVIYPDGRVEHHRIDWPRAPKYDQINKLVRPLVDCDSIEHVSVLHPEKSLRADMFVDEDGHASQKPRNDLATAIYRANYIQQYPSVDPESLSFIVGNAVLFDRVIWT